MEVQQTNLVLHNVALWIVLLDGTRSRVLPLHVGYLLPVEFRVPLQRVLNLAPCTVRKVGHGVCLVEDASRVLAIRGQLARDHAVYLVVALYLRDLAQDVVDVPGTFGCRRSGPNLMVP